MLIFKECLNKTSCGCLYLKVILPSLKKNRHAIYHNASVFTIMYVSFNILFSETEAQIVFSVVSLQYSRKQKY